MSSHRSQQTSPLGSSGSDDEPRLVAPESKSPADYRILRDSVNATLEQRGFPKGSPRVMMADELSNIPTARHAPSRTVAGATVSTPADRWVGQHEIVEIDGILIRGGMFFLALRLPTLNEISDATIYANLGAPIGGAGKLAKSQSLGYWSFDQKKRRSYLRWLADGRRDPDVEDDFFLAYFFGLERRIVDDGRFDQEAFADFPPLLAALDALLDLYKRRRTAFQAPIMVTHGQALQQYLRMKLHPDLPYEPIASLSVYGEELPFQLRRKLGQAAFDGLPIPVELAFDWAREMVRPVVMWTNPDIWKKIFFSAYASDFGDGIRIGSGEYPTLMYRYTPMSAVLQNKRGEVSLPFAGVPDISSCEEIFELLRDLTNECARTLAPYNRCVSKLKQQYPSRHDDLLHLADFLLPVAVWPPVLASRLHELRDRLGNGPLPMRVQELAEIFNADPSIKREHLVRLCNSLENEGIGVCPDYAGGATLSAYSDWIAVYHGPQVDEDTKASESFDEALLTVDVAVALACTRQAENEHARMMSYLNEEISSWAYFSEAVRLRLEAHAVRQLLATVRFSALARRLAAVVEPAKTAIAEFAVRLVLHDGSYAPALITTLQKLYRSFGMETAQVNNDLHSFATQAPREVQTGDSDVALDHARIAALQADTAKVSNLLSRIFDESADAHDTQGIAASSNVPAAPAQNMPAHAAGTGSPVAGLDASHFSFATRLACQKVWDRIDVVALAKEFGLMPDGALEQLNDATFDAFDMPFAEGEDPIEINQDVIANFQ